METELIYTHCRNLFIGDTFKPFVHKYFKDVKFLGCESGSWGPHISITNWDEVKDTLPKSYRPVEVKNIN